jgi:hypothetical protein
MTDFEFVTFELPSSKAGIAQLLTAARIASRAMKVADLNSIAEAPADSVTEAIETMNYAAEQFDRLSALCAAGASRMQAAHAAVASRTHGEQSLNGSWRGAGTMPPVQLT